MACSREKLVRAGSHWFTATNSYDQKTGLATFNQHWFIKRGRLFERRLVTVKTRAFSDAAIRPMLRAAGLPLFRVDTQVRIDGKPMRKLYLAQKSAAVRGR